MVPDGWTAGRVLDFFKLQRGFDLTKSQSVAGKIPVYSSSGIAYYHAEFKVDAPGVVTGRKGSVGPVYFIEEPFWPHDTTLWVCDFKGASERYTWYFLQSMNLDRLDEASSVPTLNRNNVHRIKCNFPPLPEQRKIAAILSTWDAAIETTEALLATARDQKRALMQSLLTGKRRFPEFVGEEWGEVRLGDVATLIMSNVDKKTKDGEAPVRLCNYTDVYKRDTIDPSQDFMNATATTAQIKKFCLHIGDVIITKDSETADDIAMPTYVAGAADDLICGYHLAIVRGGDSVDGRFLKYYFDLPHTHYYFGTRANGAIRFGLTIDGIEGAKIGLPSLNEQRRIASVITGAEIEINQIVASIAKLRIEKKALMQQLLTGKRRVVV